MNNLVKQNHSEILTFKINNPEAIDVNVLAKSLVSIAELYKEFVNDHSVKIEINEVRKGSYEFDFVIPCISVLPLVMPQFLQSIDNANIVLNFIEHLKWLSQFFSNRSSKRSNTEKPSLKQAENLSNINNVIIAKKGSTINIYQNNNINNGLIINNEEAKIANSEIEEFRQEEKYIEEEKTTPIENNITTWIKFTQTRADDKRGYKIICKEIADNKELPVSFESEYVQQRIMDTNDNIYNFIYLVDLKILTENNKTTCIITALKDRKEKNKQINLFN